MARKPIKRRAPGGTIHMGLWWIVGILVLSGAATVALPSVILLVLGLLPSWIAFVVDRNVGKVAGKCVLAMNLVGVAPYLLNQWAVGGAGQADAAFAALSDPYSWAVMYGAASLGWLLYFGVPHVVALVVEMRATQRKEKLARLREELIGEWGEEIADDLQQRKQKT